MGAAAAGCWPSPLRNTYFAARDLEASLFSSLALGAAKAVFAALPIAIGNFFRVVSLESGGMGGGQLREWRARKEKKHTLATLVVVVRGA